VSHSKRNKDREMRFKLKVKDVADAFILAIQNNDLTLKQFEDIYKRVKNKTK